MGDGIVETTNGNLANAIENQPRVLREVHRAAVEQVWSLDEHRLLGLENVVITGCGDSMFAGQAASYAFIDWCGMPAFGVEPLELARYRAQTLGEGTMVLAVSNSGRVSRTIEAARACRPKAWTVAVTDDPESRLAGAAETVLSPRIPKLSSGGAGTFSYLASMQVLYAVAARLSELRGGAVDSRASLDLRVEGLVGHVQAAIDASKKPAAELARRIDTDNAFFVGGGPNFATANYGAAKVMEALSLNGVPVELEEWAHLQFHITGPRWPFVLLSPKGRSRERALEQAHGILDSDGWLVSVCEEEDRELSAAADIVFPMPSGIEETMTPFVYCVPLQLLALSLAESRNTTMRMRMEDRRRDVNFRQIFDSKVS